MTARMYATQANDMAGNAREWCWNESGANGFELKLLGFHLVDNLSNGLQREPIECFLVGSRGHVSRFRLDLLIGKNVQIFFVHEPVEITVFPVSVAVQRP